MHTCEHVCTYMYCDLCMEVRRQLEGPGSFLSPGDQIQVIGLGGRYALPTEESLWPNN